MSDALDDPGARTADQIVPAVDANTNDQVRHPALPDETLSIDSTEAGELVAAFRRVRDAHRGKYVASVADLPADAVRVATAIADAAVNASAEEGHRLLEDLVDLQSFVVDPPASLVPPSTLGSATRAGSGPALLEAIRWKQAALIASALGHVTVVGDHNAIRGRWTAIGDARAAINLVVDYRETQAGGFAALTLWVISAPAGAVAALLFGGARWSVVALVVVIGGWFVAPVLGAAVGMLDARLSRLPIRDRRPRLIDGVSLAAAGVGLVVVPAVIGFFAFVLATRLGLA